MTLTLVDYGIGNLRSLEKAFEHVGARVRRTSDPDAVRAAERLIVPGVGAFGACMDALRDRGLDAPVLDAARAGTPLLGVCVGMQLLFEGSDEMGDHAGLGLLPGRIARFPDLSVAEHDGTGVLVSRRLKVPHIGWTPLEPTGAAPLLAGLSERAHVYFVHSYRAVDVNPADVLAWADYGVRFPAVVGRNRIYGVQFHPEKSQAAGLQILRNFAQMAA